MRPHRDTMNARVRAPRRMNPRALARYGMGGVFNGLLNAWSMRLPLPAHERPTIARSDEHTSELQSLMRLSYADSCLKTETNLRTLPPHATLAEHSTAPTT